MKTKRRTLIVLLVFVLAAGAALALLTHANQKAEQAASEAEDGSIPLLDGTTATLESVSIQYGGETLTLRPSDDGWTLTEDPAYHLDDSACSTIRTALAGMKAKRQLEAQPGEDYGFDAPQLVVNVSAAGESTTLTVGATVALIVLISMPKLRNVLMIRSLLAFCSSISIVGSSFSKCFIRSIVGKR